MEAVKPIELDRRQRLAKNYAPPLQRKPYLVLVLILVAGLGAAAVGLRTLALRALPLSNPFLSYTDIFPGQSEEAVQARGFSCSIASYDYYQGTSYQICLLDLASGPVSTVRVTINKGVVQETTLLMRDDALPLGNLRLIMDVPAINLNAQTTYFFWHGYFVFARTPVQTRIGNTSLFLPVWSVTFAVVEQTQTPGG